VDVHGKKYIYVVRSNTSRDHFKEVMSPEYLRNATGVGIRGLHYSATETYGDAIGITVETETPQAAKEQFHAWYAPFWRMLSATRWRCISAEQTRETGIFVGASTEHPAPSTNAIASAGRRLQ
jgi:hypothetical protein